MACGRTGAYHDGMDARTGSAERGVVVAVAVGKVLRDGAVVPLQFREAELAVVLAVQARPVSAAFLTNLLYPDREPGAANILKVYAYRLRRRIAPDFVVYADGGYSLGEDVVVDVAQGRAAVEHLTRSADRLERTERERMVRLARELRTEAPAALIECDWYDPVARLAQRLGRTIALLLARNALDHGELREALLVAEELTYADACDDEAWELLIRTQLLLRRRTGALQSYRFYEAAIAKELAARPSPEIRRLVEEQCHAASA
jgi:DNA-binding SARP family transcriptional activator